MKAGNGQTPFTTAALCVAQHPAARSMRTPSSTPVASVSLPEHDQSLLPHQHHRFLQQSASLQASRAAPVMPPAEKPE